MSQNLQASRLTTIARWIFAGPVAAALSLLIFAVMPLWFPKGAGGVDHLAMPLLLLPAVWALLFFHAILDRRIARIMAIAIALTALHGVVLYNHLNSPVKSAVSK